MKPSFPLILSVWLLLASSQAFDTEDFELSQVVYGSCYPNNITVANYSGTMILHVYYNVTPLCQELGPPSYEMLDGTLLDYYPFEDGYLVNISASSRALAGIYNLVWFTGNETLWLSLKIAAGYWKDIFYAQYTPISHNQTINFTGIYALNQFIEPNHFDSKYCYPISLNVTQRSSTTLETLITFENSTACQNLGIFGTYISYAPFGQLNSETYSFWIKYITFGVNMTGSYYPNNNTVMLYGRYSNSDLLTVSFVQVNETNPSPPIEGRYGVSGFLSPQTFNSKSCYPYSLLIEKSGLAPLQAAGYTLYSYLFKWMYPPLDSCALFAPEYSAIFVNISASPGQTQWSFTRYPDGVNNFNISGSIQQDASGYHNITIWQGVYGWFEGKYYSEYYSYFMVQIPPFS